MYCGLLVPGPALAVGLQGALESYAAGRSGEMEVTLCNPVWRDGMRYVNRET